MIVRRAGKLRNAKAWLCRCDCGNNTIATTARLRGGLKDSCGCLGKKRHALSVTTHGLSKTVTYRRWVGMRRRCSDPEVAGYANYGGRGITVCARWSKFENFLDDMGACPKGLTLDRVDSNGHYEPSNCRWVSPLEQHRNTRFNKLSMRKAREIRRLNRTNLSQRHIARLYGVTQTMVSRVVNHTAWV